jgi:hypothetical protein
VLKLRRIWAVNVGENFGTTLDGWRRFAAALPLTNVQYMYASEHHFLRTDLKTRMRDAIRVNRTAQRGAHDAAVVRCVGNMWCVTTAAHTQAHANKARGVWRGASGPRAGDSCCEHDMMAADAASALLCSVQVQSQGVFRTDGCTRVQRGAWQRCSQRRCARPQPCGAREAAGGAAGGAEEGAAEAEAAARAAVTVT